MVFRICKIEYYISALNTIFLLIPGEYFLFLNGNESCRRYCGVKSNTVDL